MRATLILLFSLCSLATWGQQDETVYRLELGGGVGMGTTWTDLSSKPALSAALMARFPLNPRMAIKTQFTYAGIKGDTQGSSNFIPADPNQSGTEKLNYDVSSSIYDISALYELHFLPYGYAHDYRGYSRIVPYVQMGFGFTYGAAAEAFTVNIPIGLGLKYKVAPRLNLGLDWMVHFSLSDKLDGLSKPLGIEQSGFSGKDHYSSLTLTITYDLSPRCPTCNRD